MSTSIKRRKAWAGSLHGLTAAALVGSSHGVIYSLEDFSAGTPNYTINGVNSTIDGNSWDRLESSPGVEIFPVDAMVGTGYNSGSSSRNGVVANSEPTHFTPGGTIPTGQHGFVSTSQNRNFTSNYAMTLASDGATSLDISLSYMFFALSTDGNPVTAKGTGLVFYSSTGAFAGEEVQLLSFGFGQAGSLVETPDFGATENTWGSLSASFTEAGAGITFTDTAAIRINRAPLVGLVSPDTPTNHVTFLDDISVEGVTGIPEPSALALLGLGGFALLLRRRK